MNSKFAGGWLALLSTLVLASCGGGGSTSPATAPALVSIALSPRAASSAPRATQQLTVTGTYDNGTTQTLVSSGETFQSSNTGVATVSAAGLVTVAANAIAGATATIAATDTASGDTTSTANSTVVTVIATKSTLVSIALSPLAVSLPSGATQQLTVTGTYSNGTTQTLAASGETFQSSNTSVATVSAAGLVTVAANATAGATATIDATDTASGDTTSTANSTAVTATTGPTANSVAAAIATAQNKSLCTAITPFYWEIGDQSSALVTGSLGTDSSGNPVLPTTRFSIASASKWMYGTYVVQLRGSAAALTVSDISFTNFTSGYTNMGSDLTSSQCPSSDSPDTVNTCLTLINSANGLPYSYQDPNTVGKFDYDSGHLENHASLHGGLGDVHDGTLGSTVGNLLGSNINFSYTEPLLAGGIYTSSNDYAQVLRNILNGSLFMRDALGTNPVCTLPSAPNCNATHSPIPEAWHYSIAHWVEDDPTTNGDGAFSSAGAFGFYPWIEASKTYYGIISRENKQGAGTGQQNGYASAQCGRLIRHAWATGIEQTGAIPSAN